MNSRTLIVLFLLSLTIPVFFFIGPLRLSAYRLFLLLGLFPALFVWMTSKSVPKIFPDFLVLFFPVWATLALTTHYGFAFAVESGGMIFIETAGTYFIARVLVRSPEDFETVMKSLIGIVIVLFPFAIYETLTKHEILIELFRSVGRTYGIVEKEPRWGLDRVQGPFEHPIHFGVYCGIALSFAFYYKATLQSFVYRAARASVVLVAATLSLSSGPLTSLLAQAGLIGFDLVSRSYKERWRVLTAGAVVSWVVVDLLSNRTPPEVFITYFAFSAHTAYNRVNIWTYGTKSIGNNLIWGIGYEEYERPAYVFSSSVDMFWILPSMQFGLLAGLALVGVFMIITLRVCFAKISDQRLSIIRRSIVICYVGIILAGWTVHYWAAMYSLVIFMFASGIWIFTNDWQNSVNEPLGEQSTRLNKQKEKVVASRKRPKRTRYGYTRADTGKLKK